MVVHKLAAQGALHLDDWVSDYIPEFAKHGKERITRSRRLYTKDGLKHVVQVDPLAPPPREQDLFEEYQRLLVSEKECVNTVRDVEKEIKAMMSTRAKEEQNISLVTPYRYSKAPLPASAVSSRPPLVRSGLYY